MSLVDVDTFINHYPNGILKDTSEGKNDTSLLSGLSYCTVVDIYSALYISTQHIHVSSDSLAYRISSLVH